MADDRKLEYIRSAVDNVRNTVAVKGTRAGSFELAYYTKAISDLYDAIHNNQLPSNSQEITSFILNIAKTINGGKALQRDDHGIPAKEVDKVLNRFATELLDRLQHPDQYPHKAETIALIEYRLRYAQVFFPEGDRRTSEAAGAFFLMRQGKKLPEYRNLLSWMKVSNALPAIPADEPSAAALAVKEIGKDITELRKEGAFRNWVKAFRAQFPPEPTLPGAQVTPKGPWQFRQQHVVEWDSTAYNPRYVSRPREEIYLVGQASGDWPMRAAVFRPERMALQETIAAAVTGMRMEKPTRFLRSLILEDNEGPFQKNILDRIRDARLEERFDSDRQVLETYVDYIMDDHFHIKNPQMEIRAILGRAREAIEKRVEGGEYSPRLTESRNALKYMVADDLLRAHYREEIRPIVDQEIERYLDNDPERRLPLKSNRGRVAWVTAGGPAAGKSSLSHMINREYKETIGDSRSLCQADPDLLRPLLVPEGDTDPRHVGPTHHESLLVRDLILERLKEMIARDAGRGQAPDMWISTMAPSIDRMELAATGGAKVNLHMVSCPVEGENGAVQRTWNRARDDRPDNTDYQRFLPVEATIGGHQETSTQLPDAIHAARRDLRLFDTQTYPSTLMAGMDSYNREMRIFDPGAFIGFVRKAFLNRNAPDESHLYTRELNDNALAQAICRYLDAGVSLNFRYGEKIPNVLRGRIREMLENISGKDVAESPDILRERATLTMIVAAQPESYMWAGHNRVVIPDFTAFVQAMGGEKLAGALLLELASRKGLEVLSVRDYSGKQLLLLDKTSKIRYDILRDPGYDKNAEDAPRSMHDPVLRGVIENVATRLLTYEEKAHAADTSDGTPPDDAGLVRGSAVPAVEARSPRSRRRGNPGNPEGAGQKHDVLPGGQAARAGAFHSQGRSTVSGEHAARAGGERQTGVLAGQGGAVGAGEGTGEDGTVGGSTHARRVTQRRGRKNKDDAPEK